MRENRTVLSRGNDNAWPFTLQRRSQATSASSSLPGRHSDMFDSAERHQLLARLMRRTSSPTPIESCVKQENSLEAHQRRKAHGIAAVIAEHEIAGAVGDETAMAAMPFIIADMPNSRTP